MPPKDNSEIEQLKAQLEELKLQMQQGNQVVLSQIPDPIKNMSEFSGNRRELSAWLEELEEVYGEYAIKGKNGAPDTLDSHYLRAIKNKIKGEARTILCANGNPKTITGIKTILIENYGDQKDLTTNLTLLFHLRKSEKSNLKFFNETKELNTKLKSNLQINPLTVNELLDAITITKYLDNIGEPLASIIRQSNPKSLEAAYQAVCINQNAETRCRPPKPFDRFNSQKPKTTGNPNYGNSSTNQHTKTYSKPTATERKPPIHRKYKAEANANEVNDNASDISEEEIEEEEVSSGDECDELNFQRVRVKKTKT